MPILYFLLAFIHGVPPFAPMILHGGTKHGTPPPGAPPGVPAPVLVPAPVPGCGGCFEVPGYDAGYLFSSVDAAEPVVSAI